MPRRLTSKVGNLDKLIHWMDHVRKASKKFLIVCQHKKDRDVMRSLKCKNVVYPLEPFEDFVDMIVSAEKPVILLFDGDRNSNSKCEKLRGVLQQRGVKVNTGFRKIIFTQSCRSFSGFLKHVHSVAGSERVHSGLPV